MEERRESDRVRGEGREGDWVEERVRGNWGERGREGGD